MTKKDRVQIGITGVLIVVLLAVIGIQAGRIKKKRRPRPVKVQPVRPVSGPRRSAPSQPRTVAPRSASPVVREPEDGNPPGLFDRLRAETDSLPLARDPFTLKPIDKGGAAGGAAAGPLELYGIAWGQAEPKAIINNRIVQPGSEIQGFVVLEIQPDKVILSDGTETVILPLDL